VGLAAWFAALILTTVTELKWRPELAFPRYPDKSERLMPIVLALILITIIVLILIPVMGGEVGKAIYPIVKRYPKTASFISGMQMGIFVGIIPAAAIGWWTGSKIVGAIICFLCAAGCGYAWMRYEMKDIPPETKAR